MRKIWPRQTNGGKLDVSAFGIHVRTHSRLFRRNSTMFFLLVSFCVYTQSVLASVCVCVGVPACVCVCVRNSVMECLRWLRVKTNLKSVSYFFHIVQWYEKSRRAHGMCLCECICVCVSVWGWWVMSGFADLRGSKLKCVCTETVC